MCQDMYYGNMKQIAVLVHGQVQEEGSCGHSLVGRRTSSNNSMYKDILGTASQVRKSGAAWGI